MFGFFKRRALTPSQKAEQAAALAVSTQDIGQVKARQRRATNAGLLYKLSPATRARIEAKMEEAKRAALKTAGEGAR